MSIIKMRGPIDVLFAFKIFSLPVPTRPGTRTFWQVPDPSRPEVKNPYPSDPAKEAAVLLISVVAPPWFWKFLGKIKFLDIFWELSHKVHKVRDKSWRHVWRWNKCHIIDVMWIFWKIFPPLSLLVNICSLWIWTSEQIPSTAWTNRKCLLEAEDILKFVNLRQGSTNPQSHC